MVRLFSKRVLAALALVILAGRGEAGLLPTSAVAHTDGDNYRYTYGIILTSDSALKTGDFFTIYDFDGLIPGSNAQPANFALTVSNDSGTPYGIAPTDDPTKPNLTWTYTGVITLTGQRGLDNFSVISTNPQSAGPTDFSSQTHTTDGVIDSNLTQTIIPGPAAENPIGVPEPTSMALMAIGLPLIGMFRHLRRRD